MLAEVSLELAGIISIWEKQEFGDISEERKL